MGGLKLPDREPIYLDTCGLIYSVERVEPYRTLLEPMWEKAKAGQFVVATSELSVMETLVKPLRDGDMVLQGIFRELFASREMQLAPTARWARCA